MITIDFSIRVNRIFFETKYIFVFYCCCYEFTNSINLHINIYKPNSRFFNSFQKYGSTYLTFDYWNNIAFQLYYLLLVFVEIKYKFGNFTILQGELQQSINILIVFSKKVWCTWWTSRISSEVCLRSEKEIYFVDI